MSDYYKHAVTKCAISHLPAGHPNACNDCDPCLLHSAGRQLEALHADWEGMYWETLRLKGELDEAREIIKPFADYRPFEERDEGEISTLTLAHVRRARAFIDKAGK